MPFCFDNIFLSMLTEIVDKMAATSPSDYAFTRNPGFKPQS
jgi:hypothetical protein